MKLPSSLLLSHAALQLRTNSTNNCTNLIKICLNIHVVVMLLVVCIYLLIWINRTETGMNKKNNQIARFSRSCVLWRSFKIAVTYALTWSQSTVYDCPVSSIFGVSLWHRAWQQGTLTTSGNNYLAVLPRRTADVWSRQNSHKTAEVEVIK